MTGGSLEGGVTHPYDTGTPSPTGKPVCPYTYPAGYKDGKDRGSYGDWNLGTSLSRIKITCKDILRDFIITVLTVLVTS